MAKNTLGYFKYIILGHIAGFLLMYGLTPILQSSLFDKFIPSEIGLIQQDELSLFPYYFWFIALLLAVYLLWLVFVRSLKKICRSCCDKAAKYERGNSVFEEDFYQCVSYQTLKQELKAATN